MEIPENLIRKIGKENFEDDYLQPEGFKQGDIPIEVHIERKNINAEKQELLDDTIETLQDLGYDFQSVLLNQMQEYVDDPEKVFSKEMMDKMIDKGYDLPQFQILGDEYAQEFLDETDLNPYWPLKEDDLVVVFKLPKPLDRFWYKGGQEYWGNDEEKEIIDQAKNVAWGDFYRESVPVMWQMDDLMREKGASVDRLNEIGQHENQKYYYVLKVSKER